MFFAGPLDFGGGDLTRAVMFVLVFGGLVVAVALALSYAGVVLGLRGQRAGFWSRVGLSVVGAAIGWFAHRAVSLPVVWATSRLQGELTALLSGVSLVLAVASLVGGGWVAGRFLGTSMGASGP